MRYYVSYAAVTLLSAVFGIAIMLTFQKYALPIYADIAVSVFFSVLIPGAFLLARNQIRLDRIHAAQVFRHTYEGSLSSNIYFEFIERKYCAGIATPPLPERRVQPSGANPFNSLSGWLLLGASLPFILFTAAGVSILLLPAQEAAKLFDDIVRGDSSGMPAIGLTASKDYENNIAIASLAFAGAFLYSLRLFFKSLVAYSPFAVTFLRAFAHMLFAVMLAVMIWRVAPDTEPLTKVAEKVQNGIVSDNKVTLRPSHEEAREAAEGAAKTDRIPKFWLMLALAIGFIPDYAFSWALQRTRLTLDRRYTKASKHAAVTPLTVIDGIDFAKSFRLEEGNISSVQNLATANPVMLHVETPYCVFLIMDWIAQAQLCAAVGPERFLLFRKINIRTIFDLERAILDASSPVGLKQIVGAVLLANDAGKSSLLRDFGVRPLDMAHREFDKALTSWVNVEVIEHLVRVIMDSLHIHRFRQLWRDIEALLPPGRPEKPLRAAPKVLSAQAGAAASAQSNGGARDAHSLERAAGGKAAAREMQTEIRGD